MIGTIANTVWAAAAQPELARLRGAMRRPRDAQREVLRRLLRENAGTELGREHAFSDTWDEAEFQRRVPLRTYEDYQDRVTRAAAGVANVLTREPVRMFEPTSGSTAATKLIPYTDSLRRQFQRGIRAWVAGTFAARPALLHGRAYWSISPASSAGSRTPGGIPIGFDADSAYLGRWRRLVELSMVAPRIAPDAAADAFQYATMLALARCADLRIVSVWNPTFLTVLADRLPEWGDALLRDVADPRRAGVLRTALRARTPAERHTVLWPALRLISCWADANAAAPARALAAIFPQADVQGKGLMATEAFVSLPLGAHSGHALALRSHFLEFDPVDEEGRSTGDVPRLAHALDAGQHYAVIVSTGGGLYRYQLQDVIEVVGRLAECPLIRFAGRQRHVSDWFGEKLNEAHVARAVREAFEAADVAPRFAMLACDTAARPPSYVLYVESDADDAVLARVAEGVEGALRASFHYAHARRLGQLGPAGVLRVADASARYQAAQVGLGQRAGDVKPPALSAADGWGRIFDPDRPIPVS